MNGTQLFLAAGMPTLAVLIGIPINHWQVSAINGRITVLRHRMDVCFNDLKDTWRAQVRRVEEVLDARLKRLEEQLP